MSWMFTRPAGMGFVNVRPTMLEEVAWFRPYMETYTSTRLAFAETGAVRSFETFPGMEEVEVGQGVLGVGGEDAGDISHPPFCGFMND